MIIDAHTHVGFESDGSKVNIQEKFKKLLQESQENKISELIIIAGFKKDDPDTTENLINLTKEVKNVHVIASLDIKKYSQKDLRQLEEYLKKNQIKGIKIYTGYQHIFPNNSRCTPIYKICEKYNVPVIFHSGDTLAGYVKDPKVKYAHPLHIDDVATDFPNLKIVIAHMGNPWFLDCAEVIHKNPNVYADISGLVVGDQFEISYKNLMKRKIEDLLAYVGENKLLYGTDWPLCPTKEYLRFIKTLRLSKKAREKLLYKNAQKIFNL